MIFWFAAGAVLPPAVEALWMPVSAWTDWRWRRHRYSRHDFIKGWFGTALVQAVCWYAWHGHLAALAGALVSAAIAAIVWWIRRKPRRALGLAGAKSRALRDSLVDSMRRERRPVPEGSR